MPGILAAAVAVVVLSTLCHASPYVGGYVLLNGPDGLGKMQLLAQVN